MLKPKEIDVLVLIFLPFLFFLSLFLGICVYIRIIIILMVGRKPVISAASIEGCFVQTTTLLSRCSYIVNRFGRNNISS